MNKAVKILGLTALLFSVVYIVQPRKPAEKRYTRGLINRGSICYANSVFQALSALRKFKISDSDFGNDLRILLADLQCHSKNRINPTTAIPLLRNLEQILNSRFLNSQQDSHEFLIILLNILGFESGTECTSVVKCTNCLKRAESTVKTNLLEIYSGESYFGPNFELIDYECECGGQKAHKTTYVQNIGKPLFVHLLSKRTDWPMKIGGLELQAAIIFNKSHYTCIRRCRDINEFFMVDDGNSKPISSDKIKGYGVYMLIYE